MLYKFTGAGNNFVVLDGRRADMADYRRPSRITELCSQYHTDGLMILTTPDGSADFVMDFYNPDGSGGMMCGNGGRCIVAFADYLGLKPAAADGTWLFIAPDGPHTATILDRANGRWTVRLKMIDVHGVTPTMDGYFLNTGTRHFVKFVKDVDAIDIEKEAKPIRWDAAFQPEGTNVNFVQATPEGLKVRTFEKGVEGETLACGTGLTASAIAAHYAGIPDQVGDDKVENVGDDKGGNVGDDNGGKVGDDGISSYRLQCRRGDWLGVEFNQDYKNVYLTGPAELMD